MRTVTFCPFAHFYITSTQHRVWLLDATSVTVEWGHIWHLPSESSSLSFVLLSYNVRFCLGFDLNLSHTVFHFLLFSNIYLRLVLLRPMAVFLYLLRHAQGYFYSQMEAEMP